MPARPDWTREELILALDLYFREAAARGSKSHPQVQELSEVLRSLPDNAEHATDPDFRNPNGVGMKLSNFLRFDPDYTGTGLARGAKLEEEIWSEFAGDRERLQAVAQAIRENLSADPEVLGATPEDDEAEAPEGALLTRVHRGRERSSALPAKKKARVLKEAGALRCEACDFDFEAAYGDLGAGFAECHHTVPVSELLPGAKTRLADLAVVCANCHRMIHRRRPWLSVKELRAALRRSS